jgi:hypothetical protein
MKIAVTEKNVTGASKKIIPEMATGSLFSAPAILLVSIPRKGGRTYMSWRR